MIEFMRGFRAVFAGFRLLLLPGVRAHALAPLAINLLLFAAAIAWGAGAVSDLIHALSRQWQWLEWIAWLLWPLFAVVALTALFFGFSALANLIGAPFNDLLSSAVERALTGDRAAARSPGLGLLAQARGALRSEFMKLRYLLVRAIPLLLLFLIPGVQLAAPAAWCVFGAWLLAIEYLEYPLGNRGLHFAQVRSELSARRALALGFGAGALLLTLIPIVNFLAMPVAVAAGTRLAIENFPADGGQRDCDARPFLV